MRPVLGARGRWLASNTPGDAWAWAVGSPGADGPGHPTDSDPAVLKRTFDEAGLEERLSALRRVRSTEPAQGRAWLEAALAAEKPEVRARLLECLAVGLTDDDQTYLEGVLKDRAATVRLTAVELLLRLPGSPTAARHRGRMIDCVHLDPREGLVVTLPDAWLAEKQWTTDALPSTPPAATQATGQATGLKQQATAALVGRVPPGFWGVSFGLSLPLFLEVAQRSDFAEALLVGLVRSICLFGPPKDVDLRPLLRAVLFPVEQRVSGTPEIGSLLPTLLAHLSADVLSEIACAAIGRSVWSEVEAALPRPWPEPVALAFLQYARRPERQAQSDWDAFWQSLSTVALRLPRTCLDHPLAQLPDPTNTAHAHTTRNFNELVATRRRIRLEIGGY